MLTCPNERQKVLKWRDWRVDLYLDIHKVVDKTKMFEMYFLCRLF